MIEEGQRPCKRSANVGAGVLARATFPHKESALGYLSYNAVHDARPH